MGLLFLVWFHGAVCNFPQEPGRGELCIIWYNVENLFDPEDGSAAADDEFTPGGLRHWTWPRYRQKLTALAKVVIASGRGSPPEVVALCEVENSRVLEDLAAHPILKPYRYSVLHHESADHRGMDVACLVRRDGQVHPVFWETVRPAPPVLDTRDVMHLWFPWNGDTLDLFLVHLMSRYGGAGATANLRRNQAGQLVQLLDSVRTRRAGGVMLVAGDFNAEYPDYALEPLRTARFGGDTLFPAITGGEPGSYKYRGRWSLIDQVLVMGPVAPASILAAPLELSPLLTGDLQYGGMKPLRTYEGYRYTGGISDHLPLVIDLDPPFF
jgi:endonuclease/exonuclease/phosphatase family metal-dependent hydrolase